MFKKFLKDFNALIVSNGDFYPTSPLITSIKTYSKIIDNNFYFIPCSTKNHKNFGLETFYQMLIYANLLNYDYVIYIDSDCFITSLNNLYLEFKKFVEDNVIIKGVPDGGCLCHRSSNNFVINPFISFFNIKKISKYIVNNNFNLTSNFEYSNISKITKLNNSKVLSASKEWRDNNNEINKHADLIKLSSSQYDFLYGNNQIPWSCRLNGVFEEYYKLFYIFLNSSEDFDYMYARDYIFEADDSGISSAVFCDNSMTDESLICIHTWFSRCTEIQYIINKQEPFYKEYKRIKSVETYILNKFLN